MDPLTCPLFRRPDGPHDLTRSRSWVRGFTASHVTPCGDISGGDVPASPALRSHWQAQKPSAYRQIFVNAWGGRELFSSPKKIAHGSRAHDLKCIVERQLNITKIYL